MQMNVEKRIEEGRKILNGKYCMNVDTIGELYDNIVNGGDICSIIFDIFAFGYAQGARATKNQLKKECVLI